MTATRKKLIEVALPLDAINKASAREKAIRFGHPSTMHLWWARRPLAAARAVIFAQMVDDPSGHADLFPTAKAQEKERQRLFRIIEQLVLWENTNNEAVLKSARDEIWQSWRAACADNVDHPRAKELFDRYRLPGFHDPFAGGGGLPLEAQRLGLEAIASDLNPVAVIIDKATLEIPSRFAGLAPVNPEAQRGLVGASGWRGAQGLAEDVRYYGQWMRARAEERIGYLYPPAHITADIAKDRPDLKPLVGKKLNVIAWLWARTVPSPNPAFADVDVPLASTFLVSAKTGKQTYIDPIIAGKAYRFIVKVGTPKDPESTRGGTKIARGSFRCLLSGVPIPYAYIDDQATAGRMGARLMATVAEGERGRVYLSPTREMEDIALEANPSWKPDTACRGTWASNAQGRRYGFLTFGDYFTPRQLVALNTFSDLVQEARERVERDATLARPSPDSASLSLGGRGARAYADAVATYLALAVSKMSDAQSSLCRWKPTMDQSIATFGRQGIPMVFDYSEANALGGMAGDYLVSLKNMMRVLELSGSNVGGHAVQADAQTQSLSADRVVSTDPPYYDNINYSDLSDYFYIWLRRSLKTVFPDLCTTVATPKAEELIAEAYRHGSKEKAEIFFLDGMTKAMSRIANQAHPHFPVTIYYAFKQAEHDGLDGTTRTGWDTFLDAVIRSGLAVTGTWPIRTELASKVTGIDANMLASSIVLVCRRRLTEAPIATRREFVASLKSELPTALANLQRGNIAPVDLAQAAIGPGMAVYTRYAQVIDAEGRPIPVREALSIINEVLDESLAEQEGDFDADSRWALAWFEQFGFNQGEYGVAETLSKAKNTSVGGLEDAGILKSSKGKVRLLRVAELPPDWDPGSDSRLSAWEVVHQLIRALDAGGELGAAALVAKLGANAEVARELAYRLYVLCEQKKRAPEALAYNALVQSWPEITRLAREGAKAKPAAQGGLFDKDEE